MIKPIKTYDAYFSENNGDKKRLFGLESDKVTVVEVIDQDGDLVAVKDFFTKGGVLYFHVEEIEPTADDEITTIADNFYQQKDGTISKLETLPEKPALNRAHLTTKEFTISDFEYEKKTHTDVKNLTLNSGIERFFMVDGFYHFEGKGLFFNVSDGRYNEVVRVREAGLYFWGINNSNVEYLASAGTLYK